MKGRNRRIRHLTMIVLIFYVPIACGVAQSHIDANVPRNDDFDNFLKRDLAKYFSANNGQVTSVEYELLRDSPTQTGISYPKFYAWVRIVRNARDKEEGAVRLAAI